MKGFFISIGAAALIALFLSPENGLAQRGRATAGACRAIWVSAPGLDPAEARGSRRTNLEFSAAEILDLEFRVLLRSGGRTGERIELKLFTPRGHLYQTLAVRAAAGSSEAPTRQRRRSRYRSLTATLPVAGTTIVNNSLYGIWKAEAYAEGESSPCTDARRFVLRP